MLELNKTLQSGEIHQALVVEWSDHGDSEAMQFGLDVVHCMSI